MAIATMDQLVSGIATAQNPNVYINSIASKAAGTFQSLWTAGGSGGTGAAAGSAGGAVCTNSTTGALTPITAPTGANVLYLTKANIQMVTIGTLTLYDRLVHTSTLSGTVTTAQTVGSAALTRQTSGVGVSCWIEIYTATGASSQAGTISYTNQAGTSGQTGTFTMPASPVAGQMIPVILAAGDTGIRAVASVTIGVSTGTAGNFGITLGYDLATIPVMLANNGVNQDWSQLGMPIMVPSSGTATVCMAGRVLCSTTSTGIIQAQLGYSQG